MFTKFLNKTLNIFTSAAFFNNAVSFLLVVILMGAMFSIGALYTQVRYLRGDLGSAVPSDGRLAAAPTAPTAPSGPVDLDKPSAADHIKGNTNANIALIEYSDLDCPFCTKFHVTAQQALDFYKDKLMWVYRAFPLPELHPDAYKKAIAAECAFTLGGNAKFWDYSTIIYERSEKVTDLPGIAKELGLDASKFKTCLDNNQTDALVQAGITSGTKAGVQGTPGNFIMNIKTGKIVTLRGAVPLSDLKSAIESVQ